MQDKLAESRERERVLSALRASEARLREAQALAHVGSWELDLATGSLNWSDEMYAIAEVQPSFRPTYEAAIGLAHPDDRDKVERAFRSAVDARLPFAVDHRLLMPDGRIKFVHARGLFEFDAAGKPVRALGTIQDITARISAERELAEKSEQLTERIKELRCINQVSEILAAGNTDIARLIPEIACALPPAWLYPEITVARIRLQESVYATAECATSAATLAQDITVNGAVVGSVEVCYREPRPERDEGPFLREERDLILLVARKIGAAVERRQDEARFRQLLESAPDAMVIVDGDGRIVLVNAQTERLFGYPRADLIGQPIEILVPEQAAAAHAKHRHSYQAHPTARPMGAHLQLSARRRDGSQFPVEISLGPLDTANGTLISAAVRDITERRRAEVALQRLSRVRAMMSEINATIVRVQQRDELFEAACRIAVERGGFRFAWIGVRQSDGFVRPVARFGINGTYLDGLRIPIDPAQPQGRGPTATALREKRPVVVNDIAGSAAMQPWRNAATERGYRASAAFPLLRDEEVAGVLNLYSEDVGFFDGDEIELLQELASDISFAMQSIEQRQQLDYLAYYDPLTQLANRALFKDRLTQSIAAARSDSHRLALMVLDLERFKALNDALGAAAGDVLLRAVAGRLQVAAGAVERVARTGGDRFAVIVPRVARTAELIALLKDRVVAGLAEPVLLAGETYHPTARIGIALFPDDGEDAETLFRNAEAALKRAKVSRDPYLFYTQAMNDTVRDQLSLESQVHRAIRNDELRLYYQPKVELRSGRIAGVEALLRWPTQQGFETGCARLVEVLEDTGGIVEVGRWAFRQALQDRLTWRGAGLLPPPVAVNVSMRQLQNPAFVDEVAQALRRVPGWDAGVAPGIEFELTESTLMQDIEASVDKLQRLGNLGIPIAIDDFGSGYSSLSYLSRLPIGVLKIDRSFIGPMIGDERAANIVVAIISMARSLHLKVVAEGVETAEQLAFLRAQGCDEVQGFLFGPAVPAAALAELLRKSAVTASPAIAASPPAA